MYSVMATELIDTLWNVNTGSGYKHIPAGGSN